MEFFVPLIYFKQVVQQAGFNQRIQMMGALVEQEERARGIEKWGGPEMCEWVVMASARDFGTVLPLTSPRAYILSRDTSWRIDQGSLICFNLVHAFSLPSTLSYTQSERKEKREKKASFSTGKQHR